MTRWRTDSLTNPTDVRGIARPSCRASTRTSRVELEEAASRARRRGAVPVAVTAMRRAAGIGEPASRSRRLLAALALAAEAGRRDLVVRLLREARQSDLGELDRARLTWVEETVVTRPLDTKLFQSLIGAAEQAGAAGDHDLHADLLWLVAQRAWWVDPGPEVRQALVGAARRLGDPTCRRSPCSCGAVHIRIRLAQAEAILGA